MKFILILSMISAIGCVPKDQLSKVEIEKVDFEILTITHVSCNEFEKFFANDSSISKVEIEAGLELRLFESYIEELHEDPERYMPDVRAKLILHYVSGKRDTLCLSHLGMLYNGSEMLIDKRILEFAKQGR